MLTIGRVARVAAGVAMISAIISASPAASPASAVRGFGGTDKRVAYLGYTFLVPRSWPVINISRRRNVCVRFDCRLSAMLMTLPLLPPEPG